nr:hypothetical protein GCM10025730_30570 [Promicromonospora thailandica]
MTTVQRVARVELRAGLLAGRDAVVQPPAPAAGQREERGAVDGADRGRRQPADRVQEHREVRVVEHTDLARRDGEGYAEPEKIRVVAGHRPTANQSPAGHDQTNNRTR